MTKRDFAGALLLCPLCQERQLGANLKFLAELAKVQEPAERVASKLKTAVSGFIYRQVWREVNVERWADTVAEVGEHKAKYFTWLCSGRR